MEKQPSKTPIKNLGVDRNDDRAIHYVCCGRVAPHTGAWIETAHGVAETDLLNVILAREPVLIGDLVLIAALQGFRRDADYRKVRTLLDTLELRVLGGR